MEHTNATTSACWKLSGAFTYCGQPARFLGALNKIPGGDPYRYVIAWKTKGGHEHVAVVTELDHDIEKVNGTPGVSK